MTEIVTFYNENQISVLKHGFMDWLTAPRNKDVKLLGQSTTKRPPKPTYLDLKKLKKDSIDGFLQEPGLKAFIRAYRKHSSDYLDDFVRFLIRAGRDD